MVTTYIKKWTLPITKVRKIMRKHKPRGWTIVESRRGLQRVPGCLPTLGQTTYQTRTIACARVTSVSTLLIFLHECGHVNLGHTDPSTIPMHVEEYEAERYAIFSCMAEGLEVPVADVRRAKDYVAHCIGLDIDNGVTIRKYVKRWASKRPGRHTQK